MFSIVKTTRAGWINLHYVRQLETETKENTAVTVITWSSGDRQLFYGDDARLVAARWEEDLKELALLG
ncbi:hypothetical protein NIES2098_34510 [Calothrix sp. NIES-2098]|nr:hypothetical protein NIES2098_34510 [Calothrix sp. NIES-2098]